MLKAAIKELYVAEIKGRREVLGYAIAFTDDTGKPETKVLSISGVLQKQTLDALNRSGFVLVDTQPFPVFANESMAPKKLQDTRMVIINQMDDVRRLVVAKDLTKEYKADVTDYSKYKNIIPELRTPQNANQLKKEQEARVASVAADTTSADQKVDQISEIISNKPSVDDRTNTAPTPTATAPAQASVPVTTTAPTPAATPVVTAASETIEVPNPRPDIPFVSSITEFNNLNFAYPRTPEQLTALSKQGFRQRPDFTPLLSKLNIKRLETSEELRKFLDDYLSDKIDVDTDPRAVLNLNWMVNPDILHKSIFDYIEDTRLAQYIEKKRNNFNVRNITNLAQIIEGHFNMSINHELFTLTVMYFNEYPLEGYDNFYYRIPSVEPKRGSARLFKDGRQDWNRPLIKKGLTKIVLKKDGNIDLTKMATKTEVVAEYENHAVVKYDAVENEMFFYIKVKDNNLRIYITNASEVSFDFDLPASMREANIPSNRVIGTYFNIRSKLDNKVILPYPDADGLFKGYSESDYIYYTRIHSKIDKVTSIKYDRSEYEAFYRAGFSIEDMKNLLTKGKQSNRKLREQLASKGVPEDLLDKLSKKVYLDDKTMDALIEKYGVNEKDIYRVLSTGISSDAADLAELMDAADVEDDLLQTLPPNKYKDSELQIIAAMKNNYLITPEGAAAEQADAQSTKSHQVLLLAEAAMSDKLVTPEQVYNELERVEETGEPVSFGTKVVMPWKVEGEQFYNHLDKLEKALVRERKVEVTATATIVEVIKNFSSTEYLGAIYRVESRETPSLNGLYMDSFYMLREKVEFQQLVIDNAFVTTAGIIPFVGVSIPVTTVVAAYKAITAKSVNFLSHDLTHPAAIHSYMTKRFTAAAQHAKQANVFIEPTTPLEAVIGLSEERKNILDGKAQPNTDSLPKVPDVLVGVEAGAVTTVKKEPNVTEVKSTGVTEVKPSGGITEVTEEEQKPEDGAVTRVSENERVDTQAPADQRFTEFDQYNTPDAKYEVTIAGVIHNYLTEAEIVADKRIIGVRAVLKDKATDKMYFLKESLPDMFLMVKHKNAYITNVKLSPLEVELLPTFAHYALTSTADEFLSSGSIPNPKKPENLTVYVKEVNKALEELKAKVPNLDESDVTKLPTDPITDWALRENRDLDAKVSITNAELRSFFGLSPESPAAISKEPAEVDGLGTHPVAMQPSQLSPNVKLEEQAVRISRELQQTLKSLWTQHKVVDSVFHITGMLPNGIYLKQKTEPVMVSFEEKKNPTLKSEANRQAIGAVRLPNGYYVAQLADGHFVLFDNDLNQI